MKYLLPILLAIFSCSDQSAQENQLPNIVIVLCDDLGYGDLSSYGHPIIKTPNLDAMAEQGIRFSNFYSAAPVCSPSRVGLMTGRSPNRAGLYDFIPGGNNFQEINRHLVHMQKDEFTISSLLKAKAYNTCLSGKWHCNSRFNNPSVQPTPDHFGFDHWFATHNNAAPTHHNPNNFIRNGQEVGELEGYSCQIVVDEALTWLDTLSNDQPFFLLLTFHEPHEPIASPPNLVEKYMAHASNEDEAEYFANVENVDLAVGKLMKKLEENYGENTLIIFTSDNGPETLLRYSRAFRSYGSPGDLKGMKLWTTEAGFRVPGIIRWLGKDTYKGASDAIISSLDFLPTIAEITNSNLPDIHFDGESMLEVFDNGNFERSKPLLWAFYNALNEHKLAMRNGDWKILANLKQGGEYLQKVTNVYPGNEQLIKSAELVDFELYNVANDKSEAHELSTTQPDVFAEMKSLLHEEYQKLLEDSHIWVREEQSSSD